MYFSHIINWYVNEQRSGDWSVEYQYEYSLVVAYHQLYTLRKTAHHPELIKSDWFWRLSDPYATIRPKTPIHAWLIDLARMKKNRKPLYHSMWDNEKGLLEIERLYQAMKLVSKFF